MNKFKSAWKPTVIPTALMMTVYLSIAPGNPVEVHATRNVGSNLETSQTKYDANWAEKNASFRTLTQIQDLRKDWDGYGAEAIPSNVIILARNIVVSLDHQPEIYPTRRKTIQMQYELADRSYLEFEIYEDKIGVLRVPQRNYKKADEYIISANRYYELRDIVNSFCS